ncbi:ATP-grasp fold amidoligase family protein [Aequorivita marina]|uniref:ATP-grasp fold amidoligase family protein n=1 Tax=Aequorivita marina TaxID=3073654 RepID=UPI002874DB18|nr:ATP-grasp fold amidoligase family protein [Aequorivita sp. S2608]MDS1299090.1 ATP-grasp fold amidoligase family protein [Aequorivita sp. S2608]
MKKIKKSIKKNLLNSDAGALMFYKIRAIRESLSLFLTNDYNYIKNDYRKRFGREINLKNPNTVSEKLQWLKLFYRNENMPICSDKYDIRLYLKKFGYEHLLNDVIGIYESEKEIDTLEINSLPKSFVAKATHGSSWNLICNDKEKLDWKFQKNIFKQWLKLNLYVFGREWNYQYLKPKLLIEEMIEHKPLIDYKITCFNGEPKYFQINTENENGRFVDFYDMEWKKMTVTLKGYHVSNYVTPKPPALEKLLSIAKDLSKEFPFVRVDFYNFKDTIILGELTFFPGGGLTAFYPETEKYEQLFGSYLSLPKPNHNIELYNKINA